ncbi:MAG: peptide deformylase [Acidobacteria bacterium]|nr:peptide deformylase [Acidobacteriota bacterium]
MRILHYPEPVLLSVARPLAEDGFDPGLREFVENMFLTMEDAGGVGLAAPQVGDSRRIFVMDIPEGDDTPATRATFVNPTILHVEGEQNGDEGCLSFPGIFQPVRREMRVVARAFDVAGKEFEVDVTGLAARCILHENDHLDGIVFLDRMSALKRDLSKRKIKRLQKRGEW